MTLDPELAHLLEDLDTSGGATYQPHLVEDGETVTVPSGKSSSIVGPLELEGSGKIEIDGRIHIA